MRLHVLKGGQPEPEAIDDTTDRNRIASGLEAVAAQVRETGYVTGFAAVILTDDGELILHDYAEGDVLKLIGALESLKLELLTAGRADR